MKRQRKDTEEPMEGRCSRHRPHLEFVISVKDTAERGDFRGRIIIENKKR